jgi:hypothetical protein
MCISKIIGQIAAFTLLLLIASSCSKKEDRWYSNVLFIENVSSDRTEIQSDYYFIGNREYLTIGICVSDSIDPDFNNNCNIEELVLESGIYSLTIKDLLPYKTYYARSYIKTDRIDHEDDIKIYSENKEFIIETPNVALCAPTEGIINIYDPYEEEYTEYIADELLEIPSDNYQLSADFGFGELIFTFSEKPFSKVYHTTHEEEDLDEYTVVINGYFDGGTEAYPAKDHQNIYIHISDLGEVSIEFCELHVLIYDASSFEYFLNGEVHQ